MNDAIDVAILAFEIAKEKNIRSTVRYDPYTGSIDVAFHKGKFTSSVFCRENEFESSGTIKSLFLQASKTVDRKYDEFVEELLSYKKGEHDESS